MDLVKELYLPENEANAAREQAKTLASWDLTERQLCDLEMILCGAFSPLDGFLTEKDYARVCAEMRLENGSLWPMPITLDVSEDFAGEIATGDTIALRDAEGVLIALLDVSDIWTPDKDKEAQSVFGTSDETHPAVHYLKNIAGTVYVGGKLRGVEAPIHYDYRQHRHTPNELRTLFDKWGWHKIVAYQTRTPLHRAHQELTLRAAKDNQANLLIHPVVGLTKPGDVDHFTRVRCYEAIMDSYPEQTTFMSLLHLAMRMGGPREALWHALIRKNYGCDQIIIGHDHAGPGEDAKGEPFYDPYEAQQLVAEHQKEAGIEMVPFRTMVFSQDRNQYVPKDELKEDENTLDLSDDELRRRLQEGVEIPDWFSPPEVVDALRRTHPPLHEQGFTVFFTGLSGSGKSTIANALMVKLMEMGDRPVTLLDGDVVRKNLSSELTFSKEHRDLNITRIGYVASEITKNKGIAICAPIAPYTATRRVVRDTISPLGTFVEVHVSTPIEVCEERDRKGLYAKARAGLIKGFTGIDDPYEEPENPELRIDTVEITPDEAAHQVLLKLESLGLIR